MAAINRNIVILRVSGLVAGIGLNLLCSMGTAKAVNLITNGSFEVDPVPVGTFISTLYYLSPGVTGWSVGGRDVATVSSSYIEHGLSLPAQDGAQWLDLSGAGSNSPANSITQVVNGLNIGSAYTLSFFVGSLSGPSIFPSTVNVSIGGGPQASFYNPSSTSTLQWQPFRIDFTASTTSESIAFFNGSSSNNNISALDNIELTLATNPVPVATNPVPGPLPILGVAAAFGYSRKLRKRIKHSKSEVISTTAV